MVAYHYDFRIALVKGSPNVVAANATVLVYDPSDTAMTTPINVYSNPGLTTIVNLVTDQYGVVPDFWTDNKPNLLWKSGTYSGGWATTSSRPGLRGEMGPVSTVPGPPGSDGTPGLNGANGATAKWETGLPLAVGDAIINPDGDLVTVTTAHTSGGSYDATKFSTPYDTAVASLVGDTGSDARGALDAAFVGRPTAPEVTYFVTPRGNDANDGRTLMTAKATIGAAITAAGADRPLIVLGVGVFNLSESILYPYGTVFRGQGSALTRINYTGAGTMFSSATPDTRTFYTTFEGLSLIGPGKATATVGISLDSVSDASLKDVAISTFGTGVRLKSTISGGSVYNVLQHVNTTSCGTGIKVEAIGSNCTRIVSGRSNACDVGLDIVDCNNTIWLGGSFEGNTIGVRVAATTVALSDQNMVAFARFEGNTTAWSVTSSNVRDFQVLFPSLFGTYTIADSGARTTHWGNPYTVANKTASAVASASGSWRYDRVINGGSELPAMSVVDSITGSGTPVTIQAETERALGYFFRGKRGGTTYFDVRADGMISGGSSTTGARPAVGVRAGSQWFDTTLGKPIWYTGSAWVDATGATV